MSKRSIVVLIAFGSAVYYLQKRGYKFGFQKADNNQWIEQGTDGFNTLAKDLGLDGVEYFAGATKAVSKSFTLPESSGVIATLKDTLAGLGDDVLDVVPLTVSNAVKSVFNDSKAQLLERIAIGEGTSDDIAHRKGYASGFDVTLGYGAYASDKAYPVSKMTFAELKQHQTRMLANPKNKINSSACGKYQNTRTNLFGNSGNGWYGMMKNAGYTMNDKFSKRAQTKIAELLLEKRGYTRFKNGSMTAKDFQKALSLEWASIADPHTNRSSYNQHVGTTTAQIMPILESIA